MAKWAAMSSALTFTIAVYYPDWSMGQFTMLAQEDKEAWRV
jgi:hypothetical protein